MLKPGRGFSLIELMITLVLLAILTLLGLPRLTVWMANNRVRSSAEALQNALRLAQAEAVERSRQTAFVLTAAAPARGAAPAANAQNWYLQTLPLAGSDETTGSFLRGETLARTQSVSVSGSAVICFNSSGRLVSNSATGLGANCTAPASFTAYNLTASAADRPLRIEVYLGGRLRMCDPAKTLSSTNPDGCAA